MHSRGRSDEWLTVGLARYMTALFLRSITGFTDWRYQLRADMDQVCAWDTDQPPLNDPALPAGMDVDRRRNFVALKVPFFFFFFFFLSSHTAFSHDSSFTSSSGHWGRTCCSRPSRRSFTPR